MYVVYFKITVFMLCLITIVPVHYIILTNLLQTIN